VSGAWTLEITDPARTTGDFTQDAAQRAVTSSGILTGDGSVPVVYHGGVRGYCVTSEAASGGKPPAWLSELAEYLEDVCGYQADLSREHAAGKEG